MKIYYQLFILLFLSSCNVKSYQSLNKRISLKKTIDINLGDSFEDIRRKMPLDTLLYENGIGSANHVYDAEDWLLSFEQDGKMVEFYAFSINLKFDQNQQMTSLDIYWGHPDVVPKNITKMIDLITEDHINIQEIFGLPKKIEPPFYQQRQETSYSEILEIKHEIIHYQILLQV